MNNQNIGRRRGTARKKGLILDQKAILVLAALCATVRKIAFVLLRVHIVSYLCKTIACCLTIHILSFCLVISNTHIYCLDLSDGSRTRNTPLWYPHTKYEQ